MTEHRRGNDGLAIVLMLAGIFLLGWFGLTLGEWLRVRFQGELRRQWIDPRTRLITDPETGQRWIVQEGKDAVEIP